MSVSTARPNLCDTVFRSRGDGILKSIWCQCSIHTLEEGEGGCVIPILWEYTSVQKLNYVPMLKSILTFGFTFNSHLCRSITAHTHTHMQSNPSGNLLWRHPLGCKEPCMRLVLRPTRYLVFLESELTMFRKRGRSWWSPCSQTLSQSHTTAQWLEVRQVHQKDIKHFLGAPLFSPEIIIHLLYSLWCNHNYIHIYTCIFARTSNSPLTLWPQPSLSKYNCS